MIIKRAPQNICYKKKKNIGFNKVENLCFTEYLIQLLHFMEVKLEAERGAQGLGWQIHKKSFYSDLRSMLSIDI